MKDNQEVNPFTEEADAPATAIAVYNNDNIMTNAQTAFYSSLKSETQEEKMLLFNLLTDTERSLSDYLNKEIALKDVIATIVQVQDQDANGKKLDTYSDAVRTILIDDEGNGYNAVSKGVHIALKNLTSAFGSPNVWIAPIIIEVKQRKVDKGTMTTFRVKGFKK